MPSCCTPLFDMISNANILFCLECESEKEFPTDCYHDIYIVPWRLLENNRPPIWFIFKRCQFINQSLEYLILQHFAYGSQCCGPQGCELIKKLYFCNVLDMHAFCAIGMVGCVGKMIECLIKHPKHP